MRFSSPLFFLGAGLIAVACSSSNSAAPTTTLDGGTGCTSGAECSTGLCNTDNGECLPASAGNGKKDGTETDVDCGGDSASPCADLKACAITTDCKSDVCTGGVCQVPTTTDGVKNGNETGTDCGGGAAPTCKTGDGCKVDGDCDDVLCDPTTSKCAPVTDGDGIKNGDETDTDCGGPTTSKKCGTGKECAATSDCDRAICNATTKVCNPPSPTDKIKNGDETDIDCGGTTPNRCVEGNGCAADSDCTDFCSSTKVCVSARSCKATLVDPTTNVRFTAGISTCGVGESTDATHTHESCCHSLPLPGTPSPARLDKYEVTAGRFRQFIETVGANVRGWVSTEITNNTATGKQLAIDIPAGLRKYLPASDDADDPMNLVMQVGGTIMDSREPSMVQGCYNDGGAFGHNTYWLSEAELKKHFADHPARRFTQAQYDEKSMNCSPYWMYAAFCAWDGGRMPTTAEIQKVWPATSTNKVYPWGQYATTKPVALTDAPVAPAAPTNALIANDYTNTVNQSNNTFLFYHYPDYGNGADSAGYIAAPGRFFRDATLTKSSTTESWFDLGANLFEMTKVTTSGSSSFCDFNVFDTDTVDMVNCKHQTGTSGGQPVYEYGTLRGTGLPSVQWVGGSWEGHTIPTSSPVGSTQPAQTQYGKTGFRCARATL